MTTGYSPERCLDLLHRYRQAPSIALRNQLVQLNTGLVRRVAHRFCQQCTEPYEDLEQIGFLGLIRAIERFDIKLGKAFSSFAMPYIQGEVLHYLRDRSAVLRIPRRWQELHGRGKKLISQLHYELGRTPTMAEVADELNVSLSEWQECCTIYQSRFIISLDSIIAQGDNNQEHRLMDVVPDEKSTLQQCQWEERFALQRAMTQLDDKTQAAIQAVYLNESSRKVAAHAIGISPMTVTRHLHKGIQQLQSIMTDAA